jgi:hypothetical protein
MVPRVPYGHPRVPLLEYHPRVPWYSRYTILVLMKETPLERYRYTSLRNDIHEYLRDLADADIETEPNDVEGITDDIMEMIENYLSDLEEGGHGFSIEADPDDSE